MMKNIFQYFPKKKSFKYGYKTNNHSFQKNLFQFSSNFHFSKQNFVSLLSPSISSNKQEKGNLEHKVKTSSPLEKIFKKTWQKWERENEYSSEEHEKGSRFWLYAGYEVIHYVVRIIIIPVYERLYNKKIECPPVTFMKSLKDEEIVELGEILGIPELIEEIFLFYSEFPGHEECFKDYDFEDYAFNRYVMDLFCEHYPVVGKEINGIPKTMQRYIPLFVLAIEHYHKHQDKMHLIVPGIKILDRKKMFYSPKEIIHRDGKRRPHK